MAEPSAILSFARQQCPACRRSFVFERKSVFPLTKCLDMHDKCPACEQKLLIERNNGGGINYALTMILFFLNILWYWPLFGLSYTDNSFFYFLFSSILVVVVAQPWLMRYSRIIFLYFIISYQGVNRKTT